MQPRIVSLGLYNRARDLLGDAGLVDVAVLIGWFTMVSMTLAVYDVPANAMGLKQDHIGVTVELFHPHLKEFRMSLQAHGLGGRLPLVDPAP